MAAAAARRGHTAPPGEKKAGPRPVQEVEARSAGPRSVEMLLFATAIVRLLLVTILALVSGVFVAARGLMPLEAGPIVWTHSVCPPTLREVTTAGSRAVDSQQDNVGKDSYTVVISFSRFLLTRSPLFALREPSPSDAGAFLATRPGRHQPLLPRRRIRSLSCSLRGRGLAFETWRTSL